MFFDTNSIYPLILLVLDPSTRQQAREYDDYLRGKVESWPHFNAGRSWPYK